ncbi:Lsr2-like DNA bridging protein [Microbacterium phage Efeko]|uniref:Lsr2-like DNA bridging protein n=1 Tax=Microbacterium phage Efeko TaxID=2315704 RepID=A0A386KPS8_9CAUD|nr:Lsr2-like DNA bridging protein [Microbacterium phage Efeko]AYD86267.1 Lsr2-like DNA bridging protein [Microbacterium phage Efeko]
MSKRTEIVLVDDIDGSTDDVVTVPFSLQGAHYEIELNAEHLAELTTLLHPYARAARVVPAKRRRPRTK